MRANFSNNAEIGAETSKSFEERSVRHNFIKKVYFILTIQLIITAGIVTIFIYVDEVKDFVIENKQMTIIAAVILAAGGFVFGCCPDFRRKSPMNYICLGIFTLAEAFLLGVLTIRFSPMVVLTALGITIAVFFVLTIFAMQTKCDFTILGGFLCVCCIVGLIFGIVMIFVHDRTMELVYCSLGVLLFSLYIIFDTQRLMGGKHQYVLEPDDYVFGALNLYVDICQLFICILRLLGDD